MLFYVAAWFPADVFDELVEGLGWGESEVLLGAGSVLLARSFPLLSTV